MSSSSPAFPSSPGGDAVRMIPSSDMAVGKYISSDALTPQKACHSSALCSPPPLP
eukprot:CAMPEP_0113527174 /NCGR_PEP_ID=MMETSP0015_2-20120614/1151_1 /TAXON_ID=2838 /ORGANISM="Odontella" /LENGTH=54 /DNA_ID=CAMNT_0000425583 /DNA_START=488 /DNA_END=649 /DNA_ORIENTATION=+ /assembly_acc=CAM_ASM_000160